MRYANTKEAVRRFDEQAAQRGETAALICRAAEGLFRAVSWRAPVAVVTGGGNNGRDGCALALLLHKAGIAVTVFRAAPLPAGDAYDDASLRAGGVPVLPFAEDTTLQGFATVADCLFGTGFSGTPRDAAAAIIAKINQAGENGAFVVSADINSGLDSDSGLFGVCVKSALTVAIGAYKPGHFLAAARDVIGALTLADIGMRLPPQIEIPDDADFSALLPPRPAFCNKGSYGTVAVLGGCPAYAGAAKLANCSASALRAGCGIVRLCVPQSISGAVAPYLLESTLYGMKNDENGAMCYDQDDLDRALHGVRAAAVGMGWGGSPENEAILRDLLHRETPLILDADALNALSRMGVSVLRERRCPVIVTPHPMEFARISGQTLQAVLHDPVGAAMRFAAEYGITVLLKGTATVVTDGARCVLSTHGAPGMATAGSGDVLSGVLCGICGYMEPGVDAAALAAALCGLAGELAQAESNAYSMTAGDTVRQLPRAMTQLQRAYTT